MVSSVLIIIGFAIGLVLLSGFALKAVAFWANTMGVIGVVVVVVVVVVAVLEFILGMCMVRLGLSVELMIRLLAMVVLVVLGFAELVEMLLFARLTLRIGLALVDGVTL